MTGHAPKALEAVESPEDPPPGCDPMTHVSSPPAHAQPPRQGAYSTRSSQALVGTPGCSVKVRFRSQVPPPHAVVQWPATHCQPFRKLPYALQSLRARVRGWVGRVGWLG